MINFSILMLVIAWDVRMNYSKLNSSANATN